MEFSRPRLILLLAALYAAGLGAAAQFAKVSVVFGDFAALYDDAGAALGFIVSIISFIGIVFGLMAGLLVARYGFRRLLIGALALGAVLSFAQALLPDLPMMLFLRLLEGVSHLVVVVAAPTLMAQVSPPHRQALVMTVWSTFFAVAFALVALIGLPLANLGGLPALMIGHGVLLALVAAALWALVPYDEPASSGPFHVARAHAHAYASPFVAAPAAGWLFYTLTFVSLLTVIPGLLDEAIRPLVVSSMSLAGLAGALFTGLVLLRYFNAVRTVLMGFALSSAVAVLFALTLSPWLAVALFATLGLVQGASFAAIPELNETVDDQALANGAMAQMGNLGNTLGTPLLLVAVATFGNAGTALFAVSAFALGIIAHLWLMRRRSVSHSP